MARRECRQADLWLAALGRGNIEPAERLRLQEHLDACPACLRRARRIARIVELLHDEQPRLAERRQRALARAIEGALAGAATPSSSTRPPRSRLVWVALSLVIASALGAAAWLILERRTRLAPALAGSGPANLGLGRDSVGRGSARWKVVTSTGATLGGRDAAPGSVLTRGAALEVREGAVATLTRWGTRLVAAGGTRLGEEESDAIRLHRGRITIRTDGSGWSPTVLVERLRVRPVGTVFTVQWNRLDPPRVEVAEGRVEVTSPERVITLEAGESLPAARRASVATGDSAVGSGARPKGTEPRPKRAAALSKAADLEAIERLIAAGRTAQARERARLLLARLPGEHEPALRTLIAESLVQDRSYAAARGAYLHAWKRSPRTTLGASALYTAACLELEQIGRADLAARHFRQYLAAYPAGHQREGAYYMLYRALKRLGDDQGAVRVAADYHREHPRGQYSTRLPAPATGREKAPQ